MVKRKSVLVRVRKRTVYGRGPNVGKRRIVLTREIRPTSVLKVKQRVSGENMLSASAFSNYNGKAAFFTQSNVFANNALTFRLHDIDQYSNFTSLYDQYKILKIVVYMIPQLNNDTNTGTGTPYTGGSTYVVKDYDDYSALSTASDYRQYANVKQVPNGVMKTRKFSLVPHIARSAYQAGGFTAYSNDRDIWLDCAYPEVQHYGLKMGIDPYSNNTCIQSWEISATYYIAFKNLR